MPRWGALLVIVLTILLVHLRLPGLLAHLNSQVLEAWGDGFKTYQALYYHAKYDSTLTHFRGMNYPYGEHAVAADTQPLLSGTLQLLRRAGWDLTDYSFALLHLSLLIGIALCALFLYLIFIRLRLPVWYSSLAAIGLTMLAPQWLRLVGHFGLAHPEVLPIVFYLLLRYDERPSWRTSGWLALVVCLYSLLHFYFFAILAFTIGGFMACRWLLRRDWRRWPIYLGHLSLQLFLPLIIFYLWLYAGDPVTDRTDVPWGYMYFRARPASVFLSLYQPHWQWVDENVARILRVDFEGEVYIGFVALLLLVILFFRWAFRRFRGWAVRTEPEHRYFLNTLFLLGVLILLFSIGFPFFITEDLLAWAGPLRQFRSIGRFAWTFYYAVNIIAFYALYHWAVRRKPLIKWSVLGLALVVLGYEAYWHSYAKDLGMDTVAKLHYGESYSSIDTVDFQRYQAVLPIPYYNVGSDNYWRFLKGYIGQQSQVLSLQTGLPLTGAMLTRTSRGQTIRQIQLTTEPYRLPRILRDFPDDRPLLVMWSTDEVKEYPGRYEHLRSGQAPVYADWPIYLYELPLSAFAQRLTERVDSLQQVMNSGRLLERGNGWLADDSTATWVYRSYDECAAPTTYLGQGGFQGRAADVNFLLDTLWQQPTAGPLNLSLWFYVDADRQARAVVTYQEYDPVSGQVLYEEGRAVHDISWVFDNNGWAMLDWNLDRRRADSRIVVSVRNPDLDGEPLYADELLLRPAGLSLYRERQGGLWWNNRYYERDRD